MQIKKSTLGGGMGLWIQIVFAQRNRSTLGLPVQARGGDWLPQATALHFPSSSCQWSECVPVCVLCAVCLYDAVSLCVYTVQCLYVLQAALLCVGGLYTCIEAFYCCEPVHFNVCVGVCTELCVFFLYIQLSFFVCVCVLLWMCAISCWNLLRVFFLFSFFGWTYCVSFKLCMNLCVCHRACLSHWLGSLCF